MAPCGPYVEPPLRIISHKTNYCSFVGVSLVTGIAQSEITAKMLTQVGVGKFHI